LEPSLSRQAFKVGFGIFVEVKCIFSTTPKAKIFSMSKEKEVGEETEAKGGHWCDQTLDWQLLCMAWGARVCNRRVQSLTEPERPVTHPENNTCLRADRTRWRVRSRAIGRVRSTKSLCRTSLDSDRTLTLLRPVMAWSASGRASYARVVCELRVWSVSLARPVAFDRWSAESTIEIGRPRLDLRGHVDGAGRPDMVQRVRSVRLVCPVTAKIAQ
jgi:hypothetical protein